MSRYKLYDSDGVCITEESDPAGALSIANHDKSIHQIEDTSYELSFRRTQYGWTYELRATLCQKCGRTRCATDVDGFFACRACDVRPTVVYDARRKQAQIRGFFRKV